MNEIDRMLNRLCGVCPSCGNLTDVKDERMVRHSLGADGFWLDANPEMQIPTCEGSGQKPDGLIKPYGDWHPRPEGIILSWKNGRQIIKDRRLQGRRLERGKMSNDNLIIEAMIENDLLLSSGSRWMVVNDGIFIVYEERYRKSSGVVLVTTNDLKLALMWLKGESDEQAHTR